MSSTTDSGARTEGFTLVELLIVVVILAILAAVVIPQFTGATADAKEAILRSNLAIIRQSLALYRIDHDDQWPSAAIELQLTTTTGDDGSPGTKHGPYLRNGIPVNPVSGKAGVKTVPSLPASPAGPQGWLYVTDGSGEFRANVSGTGPSGDVYFDV